MKIIFHTNHSYEIADSQIQELKQKVLAYILDEYDDNFQGGIAAITDEHIKTFVEGVMIEIKENENHHCEGLSYDDYFNTISFDFSNNTIINELAHEVYYKEYKPDIIEAVLKNVFEDDNKRTVFVEKFVSQIESDEETYAKKGAQLIKSLLSNDAKGVIMAMCGWSVKYLLKSSYLMPDTDNEYQLKSAKAHFCIDDGNDTVHAYNCTVDPRTFKVELNQSIPSDILSGAEHVSVQINGYEYPVFEENKLTDMFSFWYNEKSISAGE